jgi:hypothetical protein
MKKGLGLMEKSEGLPSDGVWGYPPQGNALMKKKGLGNSPARSKALCVESSWYPPQGNALKKKE